MVYNLDSFSVIVVRARLAQSVKHQTFNLRVMGFKSTCRLTLSTKLYIIGVYDIWRRGLVVQVLSCKQEIPGSNPGDVTFLLILTQVSFVSRLAQSVEHQTFNLRVMGSSPLPGVYPFCCLFS